MIAKIIHIVGVASVIPNGIRKLLLTSINPHMPNVKPMTATIAIR